MLLLIAFLFARTLGHVLFLFLTASVIAFTLNPLVRDLQRLRLPRGLSVAVVSVIFATAFIGLLVALGTVVVSETRSAADRIDEYLTEEDALTGRRPASRSTSTGCSAGSTTTASRASGSRSSSTTSRTRTSARATSRATSRTRSRSPRGPPSP